MARLPACGPVHRHPSTNEVGEGYISQVDSHCRASADLGRIADADADVQILVVDDEGEVRTLLRKCFEREGFRVVEAKDGAELRARHRAAPDQPDNPRSHAGRGGRPGARPRGPGQMQHPHRHDQRQGRHDRPRRRARARCGRLHHQAVPAARGSGPGARRAAALRARRGAGRARCLRARALRLRGHGARCHRPGADPRRRESRWS